MEVSSVKTVLGKEAQELWDRERLGPAGWVCEDKGGGVSV